MKHLGDLDLVGFGQLLNVLLHKVVSGENVADIISAEAQIGYTTDTKRILYFDGTLMRQVATLSDISASGNKTVISNTDPSLATTIVDGDGWFNPDSVTLFIRSDGLWVSASSTSVTIPTWSTNTDFVDDSIVIHAGQMYQNNTGTINNDTVWTSSNWELIGGDVSAKSYKTIDPSIADNSTVDNVTRVANTYTINHGFENANVLVKVLKDSKVVQVDEQFIDNNTIVLTFNRSAEESGNTYNVTIVSL